MSETQNASTAPEQAQAPKGSGNSRAYLISALTGLLLGLLAAYLFLRAASESEAEQPKVKTGDALKLAIALITILRQVAAMGDG